METALDGPNVQKIIKEYGLDKLLVSGSTADIYHDIAGRVWRLTTDAGSHNLLVYGSEYMFAFPRVYTDYGVVGVSDDDPDDNYWLLTVERCFRYEYEGNNYRHDSLISALFDINSVLQSSDPANYELARSLISENGEVFNEHDLMPTIMFIVDYAIKYYLNIDFSPSNFMLNNKGKVVAVDPVFGPDPDVFN